MITLNLSNLHYAIDQKPILVNQTCALNAPGITCITGANGCGKSTLLKIIQGIVKPHSGSIIWNDNKSQPKIGMVFQKPLMLKRSVLNNIKFILHLTKKQNNPCDYLELLSLTSVAKQYAPYLSGGEKQKLEIARIFAFDPDVFLLDEPTSNLDIDFTRHVENLLLEKAFQGKKIICVSHDEQQVKRIASEVLHLKNGYLTKTRS